MDAVTLPAVDREPWTPADLGHAIRDALAVVPTDSGWTRPSCNPTTEGWRVESLLIHVGAGGYRRVVDHETAYGRDMEAAYLAFRDQWERRRA